MFELHKKTKKKINKALNGAVAVTTSMSMLLSTMTHAYAQSIIVDPSAPGTSFLQSGNLTPQINIANPQSGVSLNKFNDFNVGTKGLILNNSTTSGTSVIGANVTANPNLVSGPANVIVNEVIGTTPSSLTGTTEVFGQSAAVIIANPNGIGCNGCTFLNTKSSTLTTGKPIISGADVDLLTTKGTITIGPDGFNPGDQGGIFGRHVIVNGPVATTNKGNTNGLTIVGGAHRATIDFADRRLFASGVVAAPTLEAKESPFAVDASEAGSITSGNTRIRGREAGLGVNLYGDIDVRTFYSHSVGDLFYKDLDTVYYARLYGQDVRQYGDLNVTTASPNYGYVLVNGKSFTLYDGRTINVKNYVDINTSDFVVIAGEVSAKDITIDITNGSLTNNGFLLADGELTVVASENVSQQREIASEYDAYTAPALRQYLEAYQTQLINGGAEADAAAEFIARAEAYELVSEYIEQGATSTATNVNFTATTGDIRNTGGAIAATNDVALTAGANIFNEYLALRSRLDAEDGCSSENCGYRTDFHAGEILAGNDLTLTATAGNIENLASDIAAANNVTLTAGLDIVHSLRNSNYGAGETINVETTGYVAQTTSCGKDCTTTQNVLATYIIPEFHFDEENILSPARIASLYGNVDINAGSDFVSEGSEISAGGDLNINAAEQIVLTSFVDAEEDFISRNESFVSSWCGKDGCTSSIGSRNVVYGDTVLATATTNLIGRAVNLTSGENLTILGARFLASDDLNLESTNGSILIDSTDLPDTVALNNSQEVQIVELRDDVISQIFGTVNLNSEVNSLNTFYTGLLSNSSVKTAAQQRVVSDATDVILQEVVQAWRDGYNSASPTEISTFITALQGDEDRKEELARSLLSIIANSIGEEADKIDNSVVEGLDEYQLLQDLIQNGASADALNAAALTLVNTLTSTLLTSTIALEASNGTLPALPTLTTAYIEARESTIFDEIFDELSNSLPAAADVNEDTIEAYEALSVDDDFIRNVAVELSNAIAVELGREALFTSPDADGKYANADDLIAIESDASLQRLVLELSLILSPSNADPVPTASVLKALVTSGTSQENNINRIADELADLASSLTNTVVELIKARDIDEKADAVLAQTLGATPAGTVSLLDQVAASLGAQARDQRQNEVADNSTQYLEFLKNNELLTAVEALSRAESGADIKDAARAVGVQSYVSLIDSSHLAGLKADADAALAGVYNTIATQIAAHDTSFATYNTNFRNELDDVTALLDLTDAQKAALHQDDINALNVSHQAELTSIESTYQAQLSANQAQYGHLLTRQVLEYYQVGYGKNSYTASRWVTVPNTYYVNLKNAADAQANTDKNVSITAAQTQLQIDVALVQSSTTDAAINAQIADLSAQFNSQYSSYKSQKIVLFDNLNTQVDGALRTAELVLEQQVIEDGIRTKALAKGSVDAGEASLADALTHDEFGTVEEVNDLSVNAAGIVQKTITGQGSAKTAFISGTKAEQDKFIDATAWRFATNRALGQLSATPRTVLLAGDDLNIKTKDDIYVVGETLVSASNDLTIEAGRRIGILGAINSNFRLNVGNGTRDIGHFEERVTIVRQANYTYCGKDCSTTVTYTDVPVTENVWVVTGTEVYNDLAYDSFAEIGETLQLGTLMRDVYLSEVPSLNSTTDEVDRLAYARHTALYDLTSTVLSAGRDLTLKSGGDILNFGGSVIAEENLYLSAETDIRNEALRHNFTLTSEHGCVAYGCGRQGHEYKAADFLAGSTLYASTGNDIINKGGVFAAAGDILATAGNDIVNEALSSQYLYHYVNSSSFFGLKRRVEILHRAIISESEFTTEFGDIRLEAANDIISVGSKISSGGDISLAAGRDIDLSAKAEELKNYRKIRKFSGLSYGQTKTYYNEFDTAFTQLEGNNIYLDAGRNVKGVGALLFAAADIDAVAGEDITFDAHQNNRYVYTSGWSFGISFPGSGIVEALLQGDSLLDAYIATNPTLSAIHQLATADDRDGVINGVGNLVFHGLNLLGNVNDRIVDGLRTGREVSAREALAAELNPFDFLNDNGLFNPKGKGVQDDERVVNQKGYLNGIKFRFGAYRSRQEWTESFVSQLIAGEDLWLDAGKDLSLVGGTIASASGNALLYAGEKVLAAPVSNTSRTSSSGWGISIGFGTTGVSFGLDFNRASSQSELFSNATITAGNDLDIISGTDTVIMGANVAARDIYIDAGQDLIVQSRQNTSSSDSFGFSFSTDGAFSLSASDANRQYTDTPTTIVAQDRLSIYTGRTTYLLGAVLESKVGNLELDTGNLIFDNFHDEDQSTSFGISGSVNFQDFSQSDAGGSLAYRNTQAITFATVGAGTIRVRDVDDYDFAGLNRDVDNVQRITSHKEFVREIPGINLKRWAQQVRKAVDLIEAYGSPISEQIRAQGEHAVKLYRESVLQGFDPAELRALAGTPEFAAAVRERKNFFNAVEHYGSVEAIPNDKKAAIALGYTLLLGKASNYEGGSFIVPCATASQRCEIAFDKFNEVFDANGADLLLEALQRRYDPQYRTNNPVSAELAGLGFTTAGLLNTLLWCATEAPHIFVQLVQNPEAQALLAQYGTEIGSGANAFQNIADRITAGGSLEDVRMTFNENVNASERFRHGVASSLEGTLEGAVDAAIFAANVSGINGDAAQKETLDATIAVLEYIKDNPGEVSEEIKDGLLAWGAAVARGDAEALGQLTGGAITSIIPAGVIAKALKAPKYLGKIDADKKIDDFEADRDSNLSDVEEIIEADPWAGIDLIDRSVGAAVADDIVGWVKGPDGSSIAIRQNSKGLPDWEGFIRDNAELTNISGNISSKNIKFTQDSIKREFQDGGLIDDTINGLKNGTIDPASFPAIRTFEVNGQLFSLDNRRLYAFQQAGIPIKTRPATRRELKKDSKFKFSTINGGSSIDVR